ncbi:hypothetical protein EYF80_008158 [Liparis tanakae]|uniref:Uncharacterized protein n=1 Tax=Liparis tanakae TaxID=230148 RepID=A0A4Z2IWQ2_9TELE|nr:hypothetical protein EYF80_008158 [Liparis tanakae]
MTSWYSSFLSSSRMKCHSWICLDPGLDSGLVQPRPSSPDSHRIGYRTLRSVSSVSFTQEENVFGELLECVSVVYALYEVGKKRDEQRGRACRAHPNPLRHT